MATGAIMEFPEMKSPQPQDKTCSQKLFFGILSSAAETSYALAGEGFQTESGAGKQYGTHLPLKIIRILHGNLAVVEWFSGVAPVRISVAGRR